MVWAAVAVGVGTAASGYMASEAAGDAADTAADAAGRSSAQVRDAAEQARRDVQTYIPAAQQDLLTGYSSAADIFGQGVPEQQRLLGGGNLNAQQTVGGGYDQYRSALMGLPVDQSNWQPRSITPSAPIQNPFTPGMFTDFAQAPQQQQQAVVGDLNTNRDVLSALNSGALGATGVDVGWLNELANTNAGWADRTNLMEISRTSPENIARAWQGSGLNTENQETMRNLVSEISRLRG